MLDIGSGEAGSDELGATGGRLELTAAEARLLAPDHPFLRSGCWRAFAVERDGAVAARLVASFDERQASDRGPIGCIGFVHLGEDRPEVAGRRPDGAGLRPDGRQAAEAVLDAAVTWLRRRGIAEIRCPVQLSTWYGHRAMTGGFPDGSRGIPTFALEPAPEPRLPGLLASAGFQPVHRAVSCLEDSAAVVAATTGAVSRARAAGVRDRAIRPANLDAELGRIHQLAEATFRGSWGLSPIAFDEFASIYRPLDGRVDPELVRILEVGNGTAVGFVLAFPSRAWPGGPPGGAFVLKSIAVTAEARRRVPGLGAALIGVVHGIALERGFRAGIHALMADGSPGHRLSLRWGAPFRSYATYELAVR